jgi:hypothetical protein
VGDLTAPGGAPRADQQARARPCGGRARRRDRLPRVRVLPAATARPGSASRQRWTDRRAETALRDDLDPRTAGRCSEQIARRPLTRRAGSLGHRRRADLARWSFVGCRAEVCWLWRPVLAARDVGVVDLERSVFASLIRAHVTPGNPAGLSALPRDVGRRSAGRAPISRATGTCTWRSSGRPLIAWASPRHGSTSPSEPPARTRSGSGRTGGRESGFFLVDEDGRLIGGSRSAARRHQAGKRQDGQASGCGSPTAPGRQLGGRRR